MPIKSLSSSSLLNFQKYSSTLAGNLAFIPGAFDLLETTNITTNTASVTFSSLSAYAADYKHLQIRWVARASFSSTIMDLQMELNADTGNNYARHYLMGRGSDVISGSQTAKEYLIRMTYPGASSDANAFGSGVVDLLDAFSSSKNTTARALSGIAQTTNPRISLDSGLWLNTAAITSIRLWSDGSSFLAGSRFVLIGVK
jgi:hypothetical protein